MKPGDLVVVEGFTSVLEAVGRVGIILEIFVKDKAAWVLLPGVGKEYINLNSLKLLTEVKDEVQNEEKK